MNRKEYLENQNEQKKWFKKNRRAMWRLAISLGLGLVTFFLLPETAIFTAFKNFLGGIFSSFTADSIAWWTHMGLTAIFGGSAIANYLIAGSAKDNYNIAQEKGKVIVEGICDENNDLLNKNNQLTNENERLKDKVEILENSKTKDNRTTYDRSDRTLEEDKEETKGRTRH